MKNIGKFILFLIQAVAALLDSVFQLLYRLAKVVFWISCVPFAAALAALFLVLLFLVGMFIGPSRIERLRVAFRSAPKEVKKKKKKLHPVYRKEKSDEVVA